MDYQEKCGLIRDLGIADMQNHPACETQDHLTICGFFSSREEFERHAADLRARISRWGGQTIMRHSTIEAMAWYWYYDNPDNDPPDLIARDLADTRDSMRAEGDTRAADYWEAVRVEFMRLWEGREGGC